MKTIVFLADGFEECEALIVVDIMRRASIEVVMASITDQLEVHSSRNIIVKADTLSENIDFSSVGLIVLPGGRRGVENLKKASIVKEQCKRFAQDKLVAAICAAPSILAELGLLNGRRATCHPDYKKRMGGAILTDNQITIDGNLITGKGLGATFEFAFRLVSILKGETMSQQIRKEICSDD